jgi:hypothetical protein
MMLRQGCLIAILALAILIMIPVVASNHLPWWGVLLVIAAEIAGIRYLIPLMIKRGIMRFATSMILAKSQVLRGARVHIHRVEAVAMPEAAQRLIEHEQSVATSEGDATLIGAVPVEERCVLVEFTLTPRMDQRQQAMQFYEPAELLLVPHDAHIPQTPTDDNVDTESASVHDVRQLDDSGTEHEIDKITGPARMVVTFLLPPTLNGRVKFRYYFETFGDFLLPG